VSCSGALIPVTSKGEQLSGDMVALLQGAAYGGTGEVCLAVARSSQSPPVPRRRETWMRRKEYPLDLLIFNIQFYYMTQITK
jgi:hypothetical protein